MGLITYGASLQNEFKAWPPLIQIGAGFDLVTQAQWFADVATPTTKATAVPVSGEAGLDAKFTEVIKCVTDAVNEGWKQRYTYADEPRVKSGVKLSTLIWVATTAGGSGITAKLVNSDASETSFSVVATDGDWSLLLIEDHTCAGTYVELQVTKDASGTFYAGGPITVMIGADAIALKPRALQLKWRDAVQVKDLTGLADEATWTDVDCTSATSALAVSIIAVGRLAENTSTDDFALYVRRNGSSEGASLDLNAIARAGGSTTTMPTHIIFNGASILLDDQQIFEYFLDRLAGSGTLQAGGIAVRGYSEWE